MRVPSHATWRQAGALCLRGELLLQACHGFPTLPQAGPDVGWWRTVGAMRVPQYATRRQAGALPALLCWLGMIWRQMGCCCRRPHLKPESLGG